MKNKLIISLIFMLLVSLASPTTAFARIKNDYLNSFGLPPETTRDEFYEFIVNNATLRPWEDELGPKATRDEILDNYFYSGIKTIMPADLGFEVEGKYADWCVTFYLPSPPKTQSKIIDTSELRNKTNKLAFKAILHFATHGLSTVIQVSANVIGDLFYPEEVLAPEQDPATKQQTTTSSSAPTQTKPPDPKPHTGPKPGSKEYLENFNAQHGMGGPAVSLQEFRNVVGGSSSSSPSSGSGSSSSGTGEHLWEKPVIYLYPEEEIKITVKIESNGEMIESIPDYGNGWTVTVDPSGKIDGKYDYLFYEVLCDYEFSKDAGWLINRSTFSFEMANILEQIGLSNREIVDFVDYWDESLEKEHRYYAAYLLSPKETEMVSQISYSIEPDSFLRVMFLFIPFENPIHINIPEIKPFYREGFVAVEWGGMKGK